MSKKFTISILRTLGVGLTIGGARTTTVEMSVSRLGAEHMMERSHDLHAPTQQRNRTRERRESN
jgi:hypothetical protein